MRLTRPVSTLPAPSSTKLSTPMLDHRADAFAPAHRGGHLLHQQVADFGRIGRLGGRDVGDQRHHRCARRGISPAPRPSRRRRAPSARSGTAPRPAAAWPAGRPSALAISTARSIAPRWPEITTCPPPLSLAGSTTSRTTSWPGSARLAVRHRGGLGADRLRLRHVGAEQGGHGALAGRHRLLHRCGRAASAAARRPRRRSCRQAPSAVYSPSEWPATTTAFCCRAKPPSCSSTRSTASECAISAGWVFSVSDQLLAGAFEHQLRELLLQGLVDFLEHLAGRGEGGGEVASHADGLAALAREDEGVNRHEDGSRWGRGPAG